MLKLLKNYICDTFYYLLQCAHIGISVQNQLHEVRYIYLVIVFLNICNAQMGAL